MKNKEPLFGLGESIAIASIGIVSIAVFAYMLVRDFATHGQHLDSTIICLAGGLILVCGGLAYLGIENIRRNLIQRKQK